MKTRVGLKQNHLPQNKNGEAIAHLTQPAFLNRKRLAGSLRFLLRLLLVTLLAQYRFPAQPDLVSLDSQNLYKNLIAFLQLVADRTNPCLRDFTDMQQAVGSRENLDECTEFGDAHHLAEVSLADLSSCSHIANHL